MCGQKACVGHRVGIFDTCFRIGYLPPHGPVHTLRRYPKLVHRTQAPNSTQTNITHLLVYAMIGSGWWFETQTYEVFDQANFGARWQCLQIEHLSNPPQSEATCPIFGHPWTNHDTPMHACTSCFLSEVEPEEFELR